MGILICIHRDIAYEQVVFPGYNMRMFGFDVVESSHRI